MNILITRPSPDGEQLVEQLLTIGKLAYHLPLIYFSAGKSLFLLEQQLNLLSRGDFLFILSRNAILYAHSQLLRIGVSWPTALGYYSVGKSTSMKMQSLSGISVNYPKNQETSEGLLALPELMYFSGKEHALILRGNNGRTILEDTLQQRGLQVMCCECYNRNFFQYNGVEEYHRMLSLNVKTVVVTSEVILMHLYYLMPEYCRIYWLIQCQLIVVSMRLARRAKQLGWKNVIITWSANNDVLMKFLVQYA